jgi:glycosyltransferase involved in cell wall biosynthesis
VEAVLAAHAQAFLDSGYPVTVVAGQADEVDLPRGTRVIVVPEMEPQHPEIQRIAAVLDQGRVPDQFAAMRERLADVLRPVLHAFDTVIVHNVLTKQYNLPLTAALFQLLDERLIKRCLAWCHDLPWAAPDALSGVFSGYPWDILHTYRPDVQYVAVTEQRRQEMVEFLGQPASKFEGVYNGIDPCVWYGLTPEGWGLIQRLGLLSSDLILAMPVRVNRGKNIELAARVLAVLKENDCSPRLVVTGSPDPQSEDSMEYYRGLLHLRDQLGLQHELIFIHSPGNNPDEPVAISQQVEADLLRVSDALFMPSHRVGSGVPIIGAGLIGMPALVSNRAWAVNETDGKQVYLFNPQANPEEIARMILTSMYSNRFYRFRHQVRQNLTWDQIFHKKIEPLLRGVSA